MRLIAEKCVDTPSLAELARVLNVNRTYVYYYLKYRKRLVAKLFCIKHPYVSPAAVVLIER